MHLSLSDLVSCPRCGPSHGLVLMPSQVRERRVESGVLGCANCRERYGVEGGVVDLRLPGSPPSPRVGGAGAPVDSAGWGDDAAVRLGALLALADARGPVLLAGPVASYATELARLLEQLDVVVLEDGPPPRNGEWAGAGVTHVLARSVVPFRSGSLMAAALTGAGTALAEEALRAVRPTARVLLDPISEGLEARVAAAGGAPVLSEGSTLLVTRRA